MVQAIHKLALVRHGQSLYNLQNKFAGWADIDLTEAGRKEAIQAGELLRTEGFLFDCAFTSVLRRCITTLQLILEEVDQLWLPVYKTWRLNERHYGDLQDKNKAQTAQKYGEEQLQDWRRGFDALPAPLEAGKKDPRYPGNDPRYANVDPELLPLTESLQLTVERVLPFWKEQVVPALKAGKDVLLVAHGNSIRAVVKHLEDTPDDRIRSIEIATAVPVIFELDDDLRVIRRHTVGTQQAFKKKLGFLGIDIPAERLLKAFVSRGLELRDPIKYHNPEADADVQQLDIKPASQEEVVESSDVLFLSGSQQHVSATLRSVRGSLHDKQLLVTISKEGKLDELQDIAGEGMKVVLAVPQDGLKWREKVGQDGPEGSQVLLKKGNRTSELDRNIIATLFEAAGYSVVKKDNLLTKT